MEDAAVPPRRRRRLLAKFTGASLISFVFSATALRLGLTAGLHPWVARLIGMIVAIHVAFFINGRFVFGGLTRERFLSLWAAYVTNSAFGNTCNFCVFVAVQSMRQPIPAKPYVAFVAGAMTAWAINFLGARFLVFGAVGQRLASRAKRLAVSRRSRQTLPSRSSRSSCPSRPHAPAPAEREWSRR